MSDNYNEDIYQVDKNSYIIERSFGAEQLNSIILEKLTSEKSNHIIEAPHK